MVESGGELVRACATPVRNGMEVRTSSQRARAGAGRGVRPHSRQSPALLHGLRQQQRQLHRPQHDQAAGHRAPEHSVQAEAVRGRRHQSVLPLRSRPVHSLRPLRRGVPERAGERDALASTGRMRTRGCCGTAASTIGESSCVSCGHCVTVCPCNALMEKSMLGHAGFLTGLSKPALDGMIDIVKGVETGDGLRRDPEGLRSRSGDARDAHPPHQDGLHLLRRRLQLRYLDQGPPHSQSGAASTGRPTASPLASKESSRWDFVNSRDRLTTPLIREGEHVPRGELGRGAGSGRPALDGDQGDARAGLARASSPLRSAPTKKAT